MGESKETQQEVSELGTRVANIEQMVRFGLACNPQAIGFAKSHFKAKKNSAQIYLALDEPKNQDELCEITKQSVANVSKICTHLEEQGFISRAKNPKNKKQWLFLRNDVERTLGLSKIARECLK
jgi:predicted transcriptional regulator